MHKSIHIVLADSLATMCIMYIIGEALHFTSQDFYILTLLNVKLKLGNR